MSNQQNIMVDSKVESNVKSNVKSKKRPTRRGKSESKMNSNDNAESNANPEFNAESNVESNVNSKKKSNKKSKKSSKVESNVDSNSNIDSNDCHSDDDDDFDFFSIIENVQISDSHGKTKRDFKNCIACSLCFTHFDTESGLAMHLTKFPTHLSDLEGLKLQRKRVERADPSTLSPADEMNAKLYKLRVALSRFIAKKLRKLRD